MINILKLEDIREIFEYRFKEYKNFHVEIKEEPHPELDVPIIHVFASWEDGKFFHDSDGIIDNEIYEESIIIAFIDNIIRKHERAGHSIR